MMGREIKFRAWDKKRNRMMAHLFNGDFWNIVEADQASFVVMQFSGLLDKNGKEIYEGDILRDCNRADSVVEYGVDCGGFSFAEYSLGPYRLINTATEKYCEIIGNIHEHPDLLKGTTP